MHVQGVQQEGFYVLEVGNGETSKQVLLMVILCCMETVGVGGVLLLPREKLKRICVIMITEEHKDEFTRTRTSI